MKYLIAGAIGILILGVFGLVQSRAFYESPGYTVIEKDGSFEIREYTALKVVSAVDSRNGYRSGRAFSKLFGYISGRNSGNEKIAMTSPVFTSPGENGAKMSFVLPEEVARRGAPTPERDDVKVEEMPAGKVVAYRFSGYMNNSSIAQGMKKLSEFVKEKDLKTEGDMFTAGYDAPYTPAASRRNEVLIRISE